jgi:hypothetical protein
MAKDFTKNEMKELLSVIDNNSLDTLEWREICKKILREKRDKKEGINLICAKCNHLVRSFRIIYDDKIQDYSITTYCHGEKERGFPFGEFILWGKFFQ